MFRLSLLAAVVVLALDLPTVALADADVPSTPLPTNVTAGLPPMPPPTTPPPTLDGELAATLDPIIRLTPDKIEVLKLDKNAVNVIVGNSKHLLAVMETPQQVMLIPRAPGATHLQVLDARGNSILSRSVIVAAPKTDYVRIRRSCAGKKVDDCREFSVFYCPDMCHEIHVTQDTKAASAPAAAVPNATATPNQPGGGGGGNAPSEGINDNPVSGATGPGNIGGAAALP